jgi:hypothetical protein
MGGIGGFAGGIGGTAGRIGVGSGAMRSRQESIAFTIDPASRKEFEAGKFTESLRADVKSEIEINGLAITASDTLGSAGFSFDYMEGELKGRVHIMGRKTLDNNRYHITASIEETGPVASTLTWLQRDKTHHPPGNYHAVTFPDDDIRAHSQRFYYRGREALDSSRERIQQLCMRDPSKSNSVVKDLPYAEVFVWKRMDPGILQRLGGIVQRFDLPEEYDQYPVVYFLNETALKMYRNAGEEFEVLKVVSEKDMPTIPGPQLRGPYMPEEP